jgi:hypothetical protein
VRTAKANFNELLARRTEYNSRQLGVEISRMSWKTYSLVVGIIFALVALAHALRIYLDWTVMIADWSVPKSVSWISPIPTPTFRCPRGALKALLSLRRPNRRTASGHSRF